MKRVSKNIVLIGMMGSGKSVVSKELALQLKVKRYSTDELIEKKAKKKIRDIVASRGWEYFRRLEHTVVKSVAAKKGVVIDCGGGVVVNGDNLKLLRKHGTIIFLKASPAVIYERIKNDPDRPLIHEAPNPLGVIKRIYKQRLPLYSQADITINASQASVVGLVLRILKAI